jgi:mRNA-degrading endonuclease RelE of RelBE toxin-antitoxin system
MRYTVILTDEVKAQLRALPRAIRREVGHKLFLFEDNLNGDVHTEGLKKRIPLAN